MTSKAYRENFKLIDWSKDIVVQPRPEPEYKRSHLPAPRIASDHMDPVQSQLDGRLYDSKSALRATYRQAGMIEVGNDPQRFKKRIKHKTTRAEIKQVVEKAVARFDRGERAR